MEKILDLGCGPFRKYPGAVGVDFNDDCKSVMIYK